MVHFRKLSVLTFAALLAGCAVGPNYKEPESTLSNEWVSMTDKWIISTIPQEQQWWRAFNDDELNKLVDRAYTGNFDLKIAEARIRQAREARIVASSAFLPKVNGSANYTRERASEDVVRKSKDPEVEEAGHPSIHNVAPPTHDAHGHLIGAPSTLVVTQSPTIIPGGIDPYSNLFEAGFDAEWELDVFGGTRRAREAATADLEASQDFQRDVLVSLLGDVARNYIDLRGTQKQLIVTRENAKSQSDTLDLTRTRMRAGLATDLDVARAEAQVATTESEIPNQEIQEKQAIYRLGVLLGEEPGALVAELSNTAPIPTVPAELHFYPPADLIRRRPDVRTAERVLASETARIGVAKSDLYPKFTINGSLGLATSDMDHLSTGSSKTWSFGPGVTIPLFNSGELRARVRSQRARTDEALSNYKQTILLALEETENALTALSHEQVRRDSLQRAVDSNRRAVKLSNDLYKQGLVDFLSVLESQRALFIVENQLSDSQSRVAKNLVSVYKAMGGGWEVFLPPNAGDPVLRDAPPAEESDKGPVVPAPTPAAMPAAPATP